jgi:hypothetical protein
MDIFGDVYFPYSEKILLIKKNNEKIEKINKIKVVKKT